MLLVAQRVISMAHPVQGVNTYRYGHGRHPWPGDPRVMLNEPVKILERKEVNLRPGGNRVISYLDVAAPDDALPGEIIGELQQLKTEAPPPEFPAERVLGRCAVRFGLEERMLPFWRGELEDLILCLMGIVA
jgi:hypothetical protein